MRREGSDSLASKQVRLSMVMRVPNASSSLCTTWDSPSTCNAAHKGEHCLVQRRRQTLGLEDSDGVFMITCRMEAL